MAARRPSAFARYADRVTLVHAAVWTEDRVVRYAGDADDAFYVADTAGQSPTTGGHDAREADMDERTAPARRLETILRDCGVERVDYVKMDIEGAEAPILAAPLDWTDRVRCLKIEVHAPVTLAFCRDALAARGFTCWVDDRHPACVCAARP